MDKRYLLILIIIFVCSINLYLIATHSDVVGSATIQCGDYMCSLPNGFSLYDTQKDYVSCGNPDNKMMINIYHDISKNNNYKSKYDDINSSKEYKIYSNGTITHEGIEISSIFYQNIEYKQNRSTFYFTKDNNSFRILITDFDYNNQRDEVIDIASLIVESMRYNYKMEK